MFLANSARLDFDLRNNAAPKCDCSPIFYPIYFPLDFNNPLQPIKKTLVKGFGDKVKLDGDF
jgi:hypothetical protein